MDVLAATLADFLTPTLHLLMSKSVKNTKQMFLEGAGVGCGMIVCREPAGMWSWCPGPRCLLEPCMERELLITPVLSPELPRCVCRRAGRVPVLLCRSRQPQHELPWCYLHVICIADRIWGEERINRLVSKHKTCKLCADNTALFLLAQVVYLF